MQIQGNGETDTALQPVALLVGASRAQVRTFGPAIERAGYQIAITTAAEHISDSHKPDRTTLLVCNQDIGPTAMLAAYHALPHRPALVVLHQQHALPGEGFAPEDRVSCGAVALERLLRQHAMPEPAATVDDTPPDAPEAPAPAPAAPPSVEPIAPTPAPAYGEEPEAKPEPEPEAEPETEAEPLTTVAYAEEPETEAEPLTTATYTEEPETETEPLTTVAYAEEPEAEPEPEPAEPPPPPLVTSPAPVEPMVIEPAPASFEEERYTADVREDTPAADDDDLPWERALEQEETEGPGPLWRRPLFWGAAAVVLAVVVGLVLLQQRSGTSVAQPPRPTPTPTTAQIVADSSTPASAAALSTPSPTIPNPPTATAAPVTTPTAAPSDPVPQDIDLVAQVLGIEPAQPQANEVVNVRVKIENRGSQDITQPFWVDLYVSPAQTPTVNQAWSDICQYGATWEVPRLSANESLVLETLQADTVRSNLFRLPEPNVEHIYVLIDSYGDEGNGAIIERDEENNLAEPIQVSISPQQAQP